MKNITILIVEDEPLIADDISFTLQDIGYNIAGICMSAIDALKILDEAEVDLILMDINIEGDIDGIELATKVKNDYGVPFIYLTSYSDHSTLEKAKKTKPLAYLVKPINEKDLLATIEIAIDNYEENIANNERKDHLNDTIFIKESYTFYKLKIKDILYAEAHDNYSFVYTNDKKYLISNTLKLMENRLKAWNFNRVHRSYLVNQDLISKIEDGYVFIDHHKIPISKKYRKDFLNGLDVL
jgi:DNA-binding LytR/AlgR family response regulator